MKKLLFVPDIVDDRLFFAKRRLEDLNRLEQSHGGELGTASPRDRQQLAQEFFFHLVGAVEFLAQVVNRSKDLKIPIECVAPREVCKKLGCNDPIGELLNKLHPATRNKPLPQDPYSEEGCHFRILVMRHRVCHHNHNPFHFRVGSMLLTSLSVDPRNRSLGTSKKSALDELHHFWELVNGKCQYILRQL